MRFLLVVKQKKNVEAFQDVLVRLLDAGHDVRLAIQERLEQERADNVTTRLQRDGFQLVPCPEGRGDEWRAAAPLLRSDWRP